ncbi:LysR family transcriptional regulator [Parathalassolituus penaei]|uniref:LysR family transcriptional regulator n=1 Tax=Parathalassolituus penaei TaxID=2997323 RepID=A0A9X3EH08_9GAMM|nr:LysR family transcriptional regulator [Parathalassolituus penaei]MCY0966589.1 LysR family transcriptional regulator [Parathalassolituus penaei]
MDSQLLQSFLAVASCQSFSLAAEQLHLTQSAVSKRIQLLEQQLDSPLFDRHNRTVSLTESGLQLLPRARQILDLIADTRQELHNLSGAVSGTLSLATSHHIGLHRLPPVLREFVSRYPAATLDIRFVGSEGAYRLIEQRQVELALTTLDDQHPTFMDCTPLWVDDMLCVCGHEHPLARMKQLKLADLAATPAILPENDTITFRMVDRVFRQSGLSLRNAMPTNYLETIKMMVSVGLGWSLIPASMADDQVHILEWPGIPVQRHLGLVHLRERSLGNAAKALIQLLNDSIRN